MVTSITLQNYKSFGEKQTIPLEPITVVVGPNNSGKSCFLQIGRVVQAAIRSAADAILGEGGPQFLFHRPPVVDGTLVIGWELSREPDIGSYGEFELHPARLSRGPVQMDPPPSSLIGSRIVKLSLEALRQDAEVVPEPQLGSDGAGLAAVLGLWRGSDPERSDELDRFLHKCLPEVRRALVKPAPRKSYQRLWIEQDDGEQFDAPHLSDGVLFFTALAMHAIDAPRGAMIFVEEPEHCVHPRRISDLVEPFRRLTSERGCQFVIATHSPVLLNEFRDEPEAIVLFRRGEQGTRVKRLSELPELAGVLYKTEPGELLANGFFNDPF